MTLRSNGRTIVYFVTLFIAGVMPLLAASVPVAPAVQVPPTYLRTEYAVNPIGIDVMRPRLSWQLQSEARGAMQSAYQIQVAPSATALSSGVDLNWDSGKILSDQSIHVEYQGPALSSGQRCYWRVRIWDETAETTGWSEPAFWEIGLLEPGDWHAEWITADADEAPDMSEPAWMYRKEFRLGGSVQSARIYVTSLGLYELELNGDVVGDQVFTPGWTSYDHRLQYQVFDVTRLLVEGDNAVGVTVGDGWYRGYLAFRGQRNLYGDYGALLLQIHVTYDDGREQLIATDDTWKTATGPILMSDIYMGETYDARLELPGWSSADYDAADWLGVRLVEHSKDILVASEGPPIRRIEEITPVEILTTPEGDTVFDMGQNMVGRIRLSLRGPSGTVVTLRHAEVLDKDGNFYTDNLRAAKQTVQYTLKGEGLEVYEPRFSFQGFRYVAVNGYPGEPSLHDLTGVVIHSDMAPTGFFETSDELLNQLQHNIFWGQKGNFLDVPTDCPQRDERLGWTGDAQVFARTAAFNMDVASFFSKWLKDLAADQEEDGRIPHVIPDVLGQGGAAAWADAGVIIPWTMYLVYGDKRILETQYASMKAWVEYMRSRAGEDRIWSEDFTFGDWLAFSTNRSDYPGATTGKDFVSTAYFAHSTDLVQRAAVVLGKSADAADYAALLEEIKAAFNREFVTETGRVSENTQTAYTLALAFDLLPEGLTKEAAGRLAADVRGRDNHLTTGFVGTPDLCHTLSRYDYLDVAYDLLLQDTYPSWLYPVKKGATTIWERWDGIKPDSSFQDVGMNSFNHYAYGAIGDWMYRVVAGIEIDPDNPGYKHVLIQPRPGADLSWVKARINTMYGEVASHWEYEDDTFRMIVRIPPNTRATIRLPGASLDEVLESGEPLSSAVGIDASSQNGDVVVVEAGSGHYIFTYSAKKPIEGDSE